MNSYEDKSLLLPFMVYQAINEKILNEMGRADDCKSKYVIQQTHLVILGDFVERYLGFDSKKFLEDVREEIAQQSGKSVGDITVTELNLYHYKLGAIFWDSIPLLQEMEAVGWVEIVHLGFLTKWYREISSSSGFNFLVHNERFLQTTSGWFFVFYK